MRPQKTILDPEDSDFLATNAKWSILKWEPMADSGEALNVGAILELDSHISGHVLIRPEVLRCMYGAAADPALRLITYALDAATELAKIEGLDFATQHPALGNCRFGIVNATCADDVRDAIRQIISECCSLGVLSSEPEEEADTEPLEDRDVQRQWTTKIRNVIQVERPDLIRYFGGQAMIVDHGEPVRFGFLTPQFAAHFGLLKPNEQRRGMKDARSKMWELALAKERNPSLATALVLGAPRPDDILLTDRTLAQILTNLNELRSEAQQRDLALMPVHSEHEAAEAIIDLA
jgi:hypothetical protein